jgi:hypothetical protein
LIGSQLYACGAEVFAADASLRHLGVAARLPGNVVAMASGPGIVSVAAASTISLLGPNASSVGPPWRELSRWDAGEPLNGVACTTDIVITTGVNSLSVWTASAAGFTSKNSSQTGNGSNEDGNSTSNWKCLWRRLVAAPVSHVTLTLDGRFFATATLDEFAAKVWSPSGASIFSYVALPHPCPLVGLSWRPSLVFKKYSAVLLSSCRDQICRLWGEVAIAGSAPVFYQLGSFWLCFFLAKSIFAFTLMHTRLSPQLLFLLPISFMFLDTQYPLRFLFTGFL